MNDVRGLDELEAGMFAVPRPPVRVPNLQSGPTTLNGSRSVWLLAC